MRQQVFEDRYAPEWAALERWLERRRSTAKKKDAAAALDEAQVPQRYRRLCHQLALARDRRYGAQVVERLHRLASEIHQVLYGARSGDRSRWLGYFYGGFARIVRAERRAVLAAAVLFGVPFIGMGVLTWLYPDAALYVVPAEQIAEFEEMYGRNADRLGRRGAETDFAMFGFYIFNNVRIAFQMFAGGLLFGIGALFFLLFNGVALGTVFGYVTNAGLGVAFYSFVAGHSALELTGLVLAGAAGLKLGGALVAPGRLTRTQALVAAGRAAAGIMYGAAAMLFAAAFVEAFWSPRGAIEPAIKYAVGAAGWVLVVGYFLFAGRDRGS
ncbi:MAG TPA: stage II sporulation protein M [Burkholderiales bacterium]|nr:stage II sporulation protein M [Burkholderiales bacterium]